MRIKFLFPLAVICLFACNDTDKSETEVTSASTDTTASFNLAEARATVETLNSNFAETVRKGDSVGLANFYHTDASVLFPNSEPMSKSNLAAAFGGMFRMGIKDTRLTTTDLTGNAEILLETGTYEMYDSTKKTLDKGKYLVGWKQENGQWKIYRDMINTSMPH